MINDIIACLKLSFYIVIILILACVWLGCLIFAVYNLIEMKIISFIINFIIVFIITFIGVYFMSEV